MHITVSLKAYFIMLTLPIVTIIQIYACRRQSVNVTFYYIKNGMLCLPVKTNNRTHAHTPGIDYKNLYTDKNTFHITFRKKISGEKL